MKNNLPKFIIDYNANNCLKECKKKVNELLRANGFTVQKEKEVNFESKFLVMDLNREGFSYYGGAWEISRLGPSIKDSLVLTMPDDFPKLKSYFEEKFDIGKWYGCERTFVLPIKEVEGEEIYFSCVGLTKRGDKWEWTEEGVCDLTGMIQADIKTVKELLIKEAERRGFKEGVRIKDTDFYPDDCLCTLEEKGLFIDGILIFDFKTGKWAEIIEEKEEPKRGEVYFLAWRYDGLYTTCRIIRVGDVYDDQIETMTSINEKGNYCTIAMAPRYEYKNRNVTNFRKATPEEEQKLIKAEHENGWHWCDDQEKLLKLKLIPGRYYEFKDSYREKSFYFYIKGARDGFVFFESINGEYEKIDPQGLSEPAIGIGSLCYESATETTKEAYEAQHEKSKFQNGGIENKGEEMIIPKNGDPFKALSTAFRDAAAVVEIAKEHKKILGENKELKAALEKLKKQHPTPSAAIAHIDQKQSQRIIELKEENDRLKMEIEELKFYKAKFNELKTLINY